MQFHGLFSATAASLPLARWLPDLRTVGHVGRLQHRLLAAARQTKFDLQRPPYDFPGMAQAPTVTIAYYTVLEEERTGWTGGLLLLNPGGRPLEFQCTLPVRPTRAHEILYGLTLRQHLIGEVIGPLLIEKCRTPISLLCCDQVEALELSAAASFPVAMIVEGPKRSSKPNVHELSVVDAQTPAFDSPMDSNSEPIGISSTMSRVHLAGSPLWVQEQDTERVQEIVAQLSDLQDAVEPFERIREAIREAQSQIARIPAARPASAA